MREILTKIQYPKLILLGFSIFLAYFLFEVDFFEEFAKKLNAHGYASIFLAGFLFAYGFTAPFAVGFFISLASQVNIFLAAPLAGFGALLSDLLIFRFIRSSFGDELNRLKLTFWFQRIRGLFDNHFSERLKKYFLWTIAGFLIASPLPDELGVSFVSGFTSMNKKVFSAISFCLNSTGILVVLLLAK